MEYRQLGSSGLRLSEVGFGCGNTAAAMISGSPKERVELIGRALEYGVDHFDTAPNYGEGASEINLGVALREVSAHPSVATKVEFGREHLDDIPGHITQSIDESLQRLGMDSVDVVYLHNRISMERVVRDGVHGSNMSVEDILGADGVLETLDRVRQAGKVRYIGICAPGAEPAAIKQVLATKKFDCIQLTYNALNPTEARTMPPRFTGPDYGQTLTAAAEHGVGIVVIRPLAAGALAAEDLSEPGPRATSPRTAEEFTRDMESARALRFLERGGERTIAQAGLRFILENQAVSTVLVGVGSIDQLDQAVSYVDTPPFSTDELARMESVYESDFGRAG
jgi:aryl-alcohol dehydrogenase-like predicted oxidoreductase